MDLQLPPDIEASLRQQAAASGIDIEQFAIEALRDTIQQDQSPPLTDDEWQSRFDALVARHQATGRALDDSRDAIYPDRA